MMEHFWSRRNIFTQNNTVILKWKGTSQKQWSIFKGNNYGPGSSSSKLNHVTLPETLRKRRRDKSQTERKSLKSNIWRELISRKKKETSKLITWKTATQYFSSVAQFCPTLADPVNRSTPGLPVHHQLPEFTQTHVHQVSDAIQPSHPLSSPSPPAPNPSQHQGLFHWANSSHEVAKVLEFQLQHQSFQRKHRTDLL